MITIKYKADKIILCVILMVIAIFSYDYFFRLELHTRPAMPENSFSIVAKNGVRAIMVDMEDKRYALNPEDRRRYFAYPLDGVPSYFEDSWSFCERGSEDQAASVKESGLLGPAMKFEAFCYIEADGERIPRAIITSVPDL